MDHELKFSVNANNFNKIWCGAARNMNHSKGINSIVKASNSKKINNNKFYFWENLPSNF